MGVPDFQVSQMHELLPDWINRDELCYDVGDGRRSDAPAGGQHFMEEAIPIYGIQHAIDNISKDTHSSLQYWDTFWNSLKQFSNLLYSEGARDDSD
eukprot:2304499-Karenia_brevis.AAC.1